MEDREREEEKKEYQILELNRGLQWLWLNDVQIQAPDS
jgi:hypothetical protein